MTQPEDRPDIEQAARQAAESKLRAQREYASTQERVAQARRRRRKLRAMREANGWAAILDDAFGGARD
ncbi:hypothetical protein [Nonomuraea sp. NPDC050310]|uniref:DUF7620 family protein n=1 Tax=Nonomuraea sp. NPDC050310 TaxID=3154935 RepID=UPI0033E02776